jgi:hypothetical protein
MGSMDKVAAVADAGRTAAGTVDGKEPAQAKRDFAAGLLGDMEGVWKALPGDGSVRIKAQLQSDGPFGPNLWEAANLLGARFNAEALPPAIRAACVDAIRAIRFYNTEDDYSFHGVKPEPNARNQAILIAPWIRKAPWPASRRNSLPRSPFPPREL